MGDPDTAVQQPTVLVVDDDRETADAYAESLSETYTVRTAYSGAEAVDWIDEDVAVVLLDRKMPGLSGDDVLDRVREQGLECRVVMVTAVEPDRDILDLPFDDYLVKPVSHDQIRDAVERMLVRMSCDEQIRELVAVASKMATLESKMTLEELESSAAYASLEAEFAELKDGGADLAECEGDIYAEFTTEKIRTLFN
ncbi:response regulator transcription factor [Halovenus marina]|uniref:response regulator transcription factor n=1 Tax=Halovenus marina TaxID=3396621 RepID=UPI003F54271F